MLISRNGPNTAGPRTRPLLNRVIAIAAFIASFQAGTAQGASPLLPGYFRGQAVAVVAQAQVGPLGVNIANASFADCPCRGTNGHKVSNTLSTLSVGVAGNVLAAATSTSTAYGLKTATSATTTQTTLISGLNVLGGLITADSIKAVANVAVSTTSLTPTATGSKLVNLVVAGQKISANVKPNTVINLAGLGTVTIRAVTAITYGNDAAGVEVEMLRISVTQANSLGLPVGALLIVGEAFAGYGRIQPPATIGGYAETLAVTANVGSLLQEAASGGGIAGIPACIGTGGDTVTNNVANLSAGNLLSVSTATTTAFGGPVGKANVAATTSSVGQISLLNGLITANTIEAAASESRTGNVSTASTLGSVFGSLNVAGVQIASNVPANTVISLAGIGTLVLNEQPPGVDDRIQVNGLHIVVTVSNSLGLPIGAEIFVAHAEAQAAKF